MPVKTTNKKLQETIFRSTANGWNAYPRKKVDSFCEHYKAFMDVSKTERQTAMNIVSQLKAEGFRDMASAKKAVFGDKLYSEIKGKMVIAFVVGKDTGVLRIIGSHIDSPRLDLKPNPIVEDSGLATLKTHYYGGIKKYQWVDVPLGIHGVIFTKKGKRVDISIGEGKNDPVFTIPDLEPHLARDQMERKGNKVVEGEEMSLLIGSIPIADKDIKEKVKFAVLMHLWKEYGITEDDFFTAELEIVPVGNARDVGFDRSMVGAYGQDDRVCAYASLQALIQTKAPKQTAVALFVDKEEIGSMGDTGAQSFMLRVFSNDYKRLTGESRDTDSLLASSKAISADVTVAMNPNFKDVNDPNNVSYLGRGVSIEKYGGAGGKYSTHDAHAEYMNELRLILDAHKIVWQTGELGKIDAGGGGTIAMFLSRYGMDCVDAGPCVLGMHSPFEVTSKADIYSSFLFYQAFYRSGNPDT